MGAYNTVTAKLICPRCGALNDAVVQFKLGQLWQHKYRIGDRLIVGKDAEASPGTTCTDGIAEDPCVMCQFGLANEEEWDCDVRVENGFIVSAQTAVR